MLWYIVHKKFILCLKRHTYSIFGSRLRSQDWRTVRSVDYGQEVIICSTFDIADRILFLLDLLHDNLIKFNIDIFMIFLRVMSRTMSVSCQCQIYKPLRQGFDFFFPLNIDPIEHIAATAWFFDSCVQNSFVCLSSSPDFWPQAFGSKPVEERPIWGCRKCCALLKITSILSSNLLNTRTLVMRYFFLLQAKISNVRIWWNAMKLFY